MQLSNSLLKSQSKFSQWAALRLTMLISCHLKQDKVLQPCLTAVLPLLKVVLDILYNCSALISTTSIDRAMTYYMSIYKAPPPAPLLLSLVAPSLAEEARQTSFCLSHLFTGQSTGHVVHFKYWNCLWPLVFLHVAGFIWQQR